MRCYIYKGGPCSGPPRDAYDAMFRGFPLVGVEPIHGDYERSFPDDADFIVTFGWRKRWLDRFPNFAFPRNAVIDEARDRVVDVLCVERPCLGNRSAWRMLGWNGLNGRAHWGVASGDRFECLFAGTNLVPDWPDLIGVRDWQPHDSDKPVVLLGQVERDASQDTCEDYRWWLERAARAIRPYAPLMFRPHPRASKLRVPGVETFEGSMGDVLRQARATVAWTSTAGVSSIIAGVPHYAGDIGSMAKPVAESSLFRAVVAPDFPRRDDWLRSLAYAQWSTAEIASGEALSHILSAREAKPCSS